MDTPMLTPSDPGPGDPGSRTTAPPTARPVDAPKPERPADAPPSRRTPGWAWWLLGVIGVLALLLGCCTLSVWGIANSSGASPATGDAVAVIYIDSQIAGVGSGGLGGSSVTPERVIGQLKKADRDSNVKAILLRIDSPGGTASASEEIAMEVARARKPVVASIGDVGASGAYMIASQADVIVASPSSDVGSIGVILEVGDFSEALRKLGIKYVVITEGKYKDAGSPFRALKPQERLMLKQDMDLVYRQFIDLVAKGRKMDRAKVTELATGWAWPGEKAKQLGLVDKIGNYSDAVREAARLGKISGEPRIVDYRSEDLQTFIQSLTGTMHSLQSFLSAVSPQAQTQPALR